MTDTITTYRQRARKAGYLPIPCSGKAAVPKSWQKYTDTNDEQIASWAGIWPDALNTGLLTAETPALDIDILDRDAAEAAERWDGSRNRRATKSPNDSATPL